MLARNITLCGRKTALNADTCAYLAFSKTPLQRTEAVINNRLDVIRGWGFNHIADRLARSSLGLAKSSDVRRGALLATLSFCLTSFSKLSLENSLAQLRGLPLVVRREAYLSTEERSIGFSKAMQIEGAELDKIIRAQLETLFLSQEY